MRKIVLTIVLFSIIIGCKKNGTGVGTPEPFPAPSKAVLSLPAQNEACLTARNISASYSSVTFNWASAENADNYDVVIKNLISNAIITHSASENKAEVALSKNTPYSWHVVAKSSKTTATTESDTWKFYNAGTATVSYAPFPAEIVSPVFAGNTNAVDGKIKLDWTGSDVDFDIVSYDVYLGTTASPALLAADVVESELLDVAVNANTTYYWKIVTMDSLGNTSDSGTFSFKVN